MGIVNYYREHMPGMAEFGTKLYDLVKKYVKFRWTAEHQQEFEILKQMCHNKEKTRMTSLLFLALSFCWDKGSCFFVTQSIFPAFTASQLLRISRNALCCSLLLAFSLLR